MVTFKESFITGCLRHNNKMILGTYSDVVCKLMFDNSNNYNTDCYHIYILSTTTNPFLFTFKTI